MKELLYENLTYKLNGKEDSLNFCWHIAEKQIRVVP